MNKLATEELKLNGDAHVTLHWDEEGERIGLLPCQPEEPYAVKLHHLPKDGTRYVSAMLFLREYGIDDCYQGLRVTPYLEGKMIVIPFGKESDKTKGK